MITQTYNITGMTCGACVVKAKSQLLKVHGVLGAEVQLTAPQASITMDKTIPASSLMSGIMIITMV